MTKGISMLTGKGFCLAEEESTHSPFWYLQYDGSEYGPLKFEELVELLGPRRLRGSLHFWRPGLANWVPIPLHPQDRTPPSVLVQNEIANYERLRRRRENASACVASTGERQARSHVRQPFVATVFSLSASGRREYFGTCTDLSARGLGVRLHQEGFVSPGASLALEVVPISLSGLKPFRVKGTVCWVDSGRMGLELSNYAAAERTLAEFSERQRTESGPSL